MTRPNIVYVLADDLGYGDVGCNDEASQIPTPHLDRLAGEGMRFTDAHASSAVCTPSRYSLLTGQYNWRSRLKQGIVWEWDAPLIEPGQSTVADVLGEAGYYTACIGKWHLGWDWPTFDGEPPNATLPYGVSNDEVAIRRHEFSRRVDFTQRIPGGPVDRGFDMYFGVDVPNFPPYVWFQDDRLSDEPAEEKPDGMYGSRGPSAPGWSHLAMIPEFTRRAVDLIESPGSSESAKPNAPFFLYFALTSPHSPIVPNPEFLGRSGIGEYGDFVCEVDWIVGQLLETLERTGQRENTLFIFSSDNGPEDRRPDDEGVYERARRTGHFSMSGLRGIKRDAWEGGHRVPFIASWPGQIPSGTTCEQTVGLIDFVATCADILGESLPDGVGEDSTSILPLLRGATDRPVRDQLVHHSASGKFAIRRGDWVYIDAPSGGDYPEPSWLRERRGFEEHDEPGELFNVAADLAERVNLYAEHPDVVEHLSAALQRIRSGDVPPEADSDQRTSE